MEGFKSAQKMKNGGSCYKKGGYVSRNKGKHEESVEEEKDIAKDKKIVKKAFKMHDEQSHDEKTDLSKLKKGGRAKKEVGTVKKYKTGGAVSDEEHNMMKGKGAISDEERNMLKGYRKGGKC